MLFWDLNPKFCIKISILREFENKEKEIEILEICKEFDDLHLFQFPGLNH